MFFRFGCAIILVVLIASAGVMLESKSLMLRRKVSRQHFRTAVLLERHAKLRLQTQKLGSPVRLYQALQQNKLQINTQSANTESRIKPDQHKRSKMPLLRWQQATPFNTERNSALQRDSQNRYRCPLIF